jgi:hypothetical protein
MHAPSDQAPVSTVAEAGCVKDFDGGPSRNGAVVAVTLACASTYPHPQQILDLVMHIVTFEEVVRSRCFANWREPYASRGNFVRQPRMSTMPGAPAARVRLHAAIGGSASSSEGVQSALSSERREPERKGFGRSSRVTPTSPGLPGYWSLSQPAICCGDQSCFRLTATIRCKSRFFASRHIFGRRADSQAAQSARAAR